MLAIIKDKKIAIPKAKKLVGEICLHCITCQKFKKGEPELNQSIRPLKQPPTFFRTYQ
jgi:hypothetical protein